MHMKEVIIDGKQIRSRADLHQRFAEDLELDGGYGRNLDALYDVLSCMDAVNIVFKNTDELYENLGNYADRFYYMLEVLEDENPDISVCNSK